MEFTIAFDMRAPDFGTPAQELYAAALDQCAWADELGLDFVGLGEHHATDDGYLPSPIVFAAAAAGRTRRIGLRPSVLLAPFYDPVKLAEDLAVLQIASGAYQILTPEQTIELAHSLGREAAFLLAPLLGGVDPAFAWEGLRLFEKEVWPHVQDLR